MFNPPFGVIEDDTQEDDNIWIDWTIQSVILIMGLFFSFSTTLYYQ
jgi:hypothetical protein